jgi:hypothetical protein
MKWSSPLGRSEFTPSLHNNEPGGDIEAHPWFPSPGWPEDLPQRRRGAEFF